MDDEELIKRLQEKDQKALKYFISEYSSYICTIIRSVARSVLNGNDVEELASDVFVAVWNNSTRLQTGKIKPYIAAIARNAAKSRLRSMHMSLPIEDIIITDSSDIESQTDQKIFNDAFNDAINELDENDRDILLRFYYFYQHVDEIAGELEISENAAKVRLHRARRKLGVLLTERGYINET